MGKQIDKGRNKTKKGKAKEEYSVIQEGITDLDMQEKNETEEEEDNFIDAFGNVIEKPMSTVDDDEESEQSLTNSNTSNQKKRKKRKNRSKNQTKKPERLWKDLDHADDESKLKRQDMNKSVNELEKPKSVTETFTLREPRCSHLTAMEQKTYLSLLDKFRDVKSSATLKGLDEKDFAIFEGFRDIVSAEQEEYQKFVHGVFRTKKQFFTNFTLKPDILRYINLYYEHRLSRVQIYPRMYSMMKYPNNGMLHLVPPTNEQQVKPQFEMRPEKSVLELGTIPKIIIPSTKRISAKIPLKVGGDFDKLNNKIPANPGHVSLGRRVDKTKFLHDHQITQDPNAEKLAMVYLPDVIAPVSTLKTIFDNFGPQFGSCWEIPFTIRSYGRKENDITVDEKHVIFLDKPLPPKTLSVHDKNSWYHKIATKKFLLHPWTQSLQDNREKLKEKIENRANSRMAATTNFDDPFEATSDLSNLETFGTISQLDGNVSSDSDSEGRLTIQDDFEETPKQQVQENKRTMRQSTLQKRAKLLDTLAKANQATSKQLPIDQRRMRHPSTTEDILTRDSGTSDSMKNDLPALNTQTRGRGRRGRPGGRSPGRPGRPRGRGRGRGRGRRSHELQKDGDDNNGQGKLLKQVESDNVEKVEDGCQSMEKTVGDLEKNLDENCQVADDASGSDNDEQLLSPGRKRKRVLESSDSETEKEAPEPKALLVNEHETTAEPFEQVSAFEKMKDICYRRNQEKKKQFLQRQLEKPNDDVLNSIMAAQSSIMKREESFGATDHFAQAYQHANENLNYRDPAVEKTEFLCPPENENVSYRIWNLYQKESNKRPLRIMVRSSYHGLFKKQDITQVHCVSSKLEHQPEFGAECLSQSQISRDWMTTLCRPDSMLTRLRINAKNQIIMKSEAKNLKQLTKEGLPLGFKPGEQLGNLYSLFNSMKCIKETGQYLLQHDPKSGSFVRLYKAVQEDIKGTESGGHKYHLHTAYNAVRASESKAGIPAWNPIDVNTITPFHWENNKVPGLFEPKPKQVRKGGRREDRHQDL